MNTIALSHDHALAGGLASGSFAGCSPNPPGVGWSAGRCIAGPDRPPSLTPSPTSHWRDSAMEAARFDAVVRSAPSGPRRRILAALAGGLLAAVAGSAGAAVHSCDSHADCPSCQYCRAIEGLGRCHKCKGQGTRLTCRQVALCRPSERCPGEPCTQVAGECCDGVCNGLGRCVVGGCINQGACSDTAQCCFGRICSGGECVPA